MIRAVIADDEPLARKAICCALEPHADVTILAECRDGEEAAQAIAQHAPDVVFLDVEMPRLDGIALADALRTHADTAVVFVTAYSSYAIRAFDVAAIDFILKPFDRARIAEALDRVRNRRPAVPATRSEKLAIFDRGTIRLVDVADIEYVQAADNYVELHGRATALIRTSLKDLLDRLGHDFLRVHRSYAVNVRAIARVEPLAGGDARITTHSGATVSVSRNYRAALARAWS